MERRDPKSWPFSPVGAGRGESFSSSFPGCSSSVPRAIITFKIGAKVYGLKFFQFRDDLSEVAVKVILLLVKFRQ